MQRNKDSLWKHQERKKHTNHSAIKTILQVKRMVFESVLHETAGFSDIQTEPHIRVGIIGEYIYPKTVPGAKQWFTKEIAYRAYDEFDETQIEYQKNGDLIACAEMPVDKWLIGYLLSFGAQVEIIEPAYLKAVLAAQAQEIYKKNKPWQKMSRYMCYI